MLEFINLLQKNLIVFTLFLVSFIFVPSQHWSKRTLSDDNKTLWGSWVIKGPRFRFIFVGDTGYCDAFKQIGLMYGPFDVAAIPIGSYEPRWYMKYQHVNPQEAVQIHRDIQSRFSIAIHWGTFAISNEVCPNNILYLHFRFLNEHFYSSIF